MTNSVDVVTAVPVPASARGYGNGAGSPALVEERLLAVLAEVIGTTEVATHSHFFDDLGADSMVMARFCARVRKSPDLPSISIKDVYEYPTVSGLASALPGPASKGTERDEPDSAVVTSPPADGKDSNTVRYILCGFGQITAFLIYSYLVTIVVVRGFYYLTGNDPRFLVGNDLAHLYARSAAIGAVVFVGLSIIPILVKWSLVYRWTPCPIRLWGMNYLRFWIVKTALKYSPLALFTGTPLYNLYLRALGANIGRRALILSRNIPVCTDLLTIGDRSVVREGAFFQCYRARPGWLEIGRVSIGSDAFVGARAILDIDTSVGDGAQLGHVSSLHPGQRVPAGQRWHGSPAQPTPVEYNRVESRRYGSARRIAYCLVTLLLLLGGALPLFLMGSTLIFSAVPALARLVARAGAATAGELAMDASVLSSVLFTVSIIVSLLGALTLPRLANLLITPERVYPLYGPRYRALRMINRMTNLRFFTYLFGDSSFIVYYLRWLGYDLSKIDQTGSNFGIVVTQINPNLSFVGTGTMVADGLSILNAEFSSSSFRVAQVRIGARNFLGNDVVYPPGGRTGDNCLLATKVMIPLDGEIRHNVGLLGSPSFEIPRSVERDSRFDHLREGAVLRQRLRAKNFYNVRSMVVFVSVRWLNMFLLTWLGLFATDHYAAYGYLLATSFPLLGVVLNALYVVGVERLFTAWRPLKPRFCSIYDRHFWWHERLWKTPAVHYLAVFNGTPFKNLLWRLLGVRLGARLFDDGCFLTERTLTSIGDDCALNAGSKIQCHSQEDGTFKSDHSTIGSRCTVGVGALVHYGVTMSDRATLAADAFLMKGEEVPSDAHWGGNPARDLGQPAASGITGASEGGQRDEA